VKVICIEPLAAPACVRYDAIVDPSRRAPV
jgi:hypothetical protein